VSESLEDFLARVASNTPTPGGGTVSAVCGALSVSLSRMVANLAVGKQGYESVQSDLVAIEARGQALQARFLELADADAKAYEVVLSAMRRPKGTDAERAARKEAMQAAYRGAAEVPLDTMQACVEAFHLAKMAAEKGNRNAITDAGVAALLAGAAMRGAALNVRVNLAALKDEAARAGLEGRMASLQGEGEAVARDVATLVEHAL